MTFGISKKKRNQPTQISVANKLGYLVIRLVVLGKVTQLLIEHALKLGGDDVRYGLMRLHALQLRETPVELFQCVQRELLSIQCLI